MALASEANSERHLVKLLRQLGSEMGLEVRTSFTDWIVELKAPDNRVVRIFGYDFGVNSSSSAEIVNDKCATSYVLREAEIDCIDHQIVFRPDFLKFSAQKSTYAHAVELFSRFDSDVVCKNNIGTGGTHVYRAQDVGSLEQAMARIFAVHYACAISPFVAIDKELRVIVVDGEPMATFSKRRPSVLGTGTESVAQLIAAQLPEVISSSRSIELTSQALTSVPLKGERIELNWRHNLGQGAIPEFDLEQLLKERAHVIALRTVQALQLRAASVDIVVTGGKMRVLEVNNGIMVENLAASGPKGNALARATYLRLIGLALARGSK